jgi:hypothetical protein
MHEFTEVECVVLGKKKIVEFGEVSKLKPCWNSSRNCVEFI